MGSGGKLNLPVFELRVSILPRFFRCDSISYLAPTPVGQWVGGSVMFSDFGDSYRIYRACKLFCFKRLKIYNLTKIIAKLPKTCVPVVGG